METRTEYSLIDEDGDATKIIFIHRFCGCTCPGCVDDGIEIYEEGEKYPYRMDVPRMMTAYIEGLFNGEFKLGPQVHKEDR